jgi:hypothetical protein
MPHATIVQAIVRATSTRNASARHAPAIARMNGRAGAFQQCPSSSKLAAGLEPVVDHEHARIRSQHVGLEAQSAGGALVVGIGLLVEQVPRQMSGRLAARDKARAERGGRRAAEYKPARLNGGDVRDVVVPIGRDEREHAASDIPWTGLVGRGRGWAEAVGHQLDLPAGQALPVAGARKWSGEE